VDPDIPCRSLIPETPRRRATRREQRSLIPISAALQKRESVVHIIDMHKAQHRAKDLSIRKFAGRWDIVQNRRLHEIPTLMLRNLCMAPIYQNFRALFLS
jgi:hypothetical protein